MPTEQAFQRPDGTFDTRGQLDLYCPHCGYTVDSTDYLVAGGQSGDGHCYACERDFQWEVEWEPVWTSTKPTGGQARRDGLRCDCIDCRHAREETT